MGYILIAVGAIFLIAGVVILKKKNKETPVQKERTTTNNEDKFEENKAKGDAFESLIVKMFDTQYFTLHEWRGDKYVEGNYPVSNHFPDLEVIFNHKGEKDQFAIECKWRKDYFKGGIEWAQGYQVSNYQNYAEGTGLPVYVVIGVGGQADNPKEMFLIPLQEIKYQTLYKSSLEPYRRPADKNFFWDSESKKLI